MKILAFAASNSSQSINNKLLRYAGTLIDPADIEWLDINDYEMPLYSSDREAAHGIPAEARRFFEKIGAADALLISFAEHNGSYTAAYKNLFDWASRIDMKVYQSKPTVMLATSPGAGGAANVLSAASKSAPHFGMDLRAALSVPSFYDNFDAHSGRLSDDGLVQALRNALSCLVESRSREPMANEMAASP